MKLGDFLLVGIGHIFTFFTKTRFSQNHAAVWIFFFKNKARNLKFGPEVPLYSREGNKREGGLLSFSKNFPGQVEQK